MLDVVVYLTMDRPAYHILRAGLKGDTMTVKELKKGQYFTLKQLGDPNEKQVWVRGEYDRETKKYSAVRFSDVNDERFFDGKRPVYTDYTF